MKQTTKAEVLECLSGGRYRFKVLDTGRELIGYASGKMKLHKIKVYIGDIVTVELDPYGGNATHRIIRRA